MRASETRWVLVPCLAAVLGLCLGRAFAAGVGVRPPPLATGMDPDLARRPPSLSLSTDSLSITVLPHRLPPNAERVSFDFEAGRIRRDLVVGTMLLRAPLIYTPEQWRAELERRSLEESRAKSAREALERAAKKDTGGIGKFEIPVKFPSAISGLIGQGVDINVTGREAISFSGQTNFPINQRENEIGGPSRFPDLDMRQQLQINLDGTIGDKIHVLVQHDSEAQTSLANRIKLRYEGYEDEILQRVEIGNTQLTLPGNQFVSFSGRQQGLFGAKMEARAGNLEFTAIASKQEGRTDRESFVGQSSERTITIADYSYEKNRIFWISREDAVDSLGRVVLAPPLGVGSLRVFLDDLDQDNDTETGAIPGRAHLGADTARASAPQGLNFEELQNIQDYGVNLQLGILIMNRPVSDNEILAVTYSVGDSVVGFVPPAGEISPGNPAILKVLKPVNPDPNVEGAPDSLLRVTWAYQLRNVYDLHSTGIQPDGFQMRILKRIPGQLDTDVQGGIPLLRLFGLDNVGAQSGSPPDDRIDNIYADCNNSIPWRELTLLDGPSGLLWFPGEQPFDPLPDQEILMCAAGDSLRDRNSIIYNRRYNRISSTDQKYVIEIKLRSAGATSLSLNRSNIIEGSEVVHLRSTAGDKILTRGVDYRITYEIGLIEFLTEEAKAPDAQISVDFEYAPFLAQTQKSLVGIAGTYHFTPDTELSTIWLYESTNTPYRRPRIGQEPSRAVVGGLAGEWRSSPLFLSRFVDNLPLVSTDRGSNLAVSAEAATSFPNPNTKDNIYVDDMEGTEETSNLGTGRRQWTYSSLPRLGPGLTPVGFEDRYRRVEWYNPKNAARAGDLNPALPEDEGRNTITVLEVGLHEGTLRDSTGIGGWGGVMRLLSKTGIDYSRRKFVEVWVNDFGAQRGKMYIDLGNIPEDAMWQRDTPPNDSLDVEDKNRDGRLDDAGARGPTDEDTGLDGRFDEAEPPCPDTLSGCDPADPTGDNWDYDDEDEFNYSRINGTEDNGYLDTEDLNEDRRLDAIENYFHYVIDLDPTVMRPATFGRLGTGWRLYRIPLQDAEVVGNPQLDRSITAIRFGFSDIDTSDATFQVASIEVVGNRWLEGPFLSGADCDSVLSNGSCADTSAALVPGYGLLADTTAAIGTFAVRVIDNKTGENYAPPPIDVRTVNGVQEREQSLVLEFEEMAAAHSAYASKDLFEDEDYSRYASLDFWYQTREKIGGDPWVFLRLGSDSLNFYEFRAPLVPGLGWQEVSLDLAALTQVKLKPSPDDTVTLYRGSTRQPRYIGAIPGVGEIAAVGFPTVTRVGLVLFGVVNRAVDSFDVSTGEVWVNELRLTGVRKEQGLAQRVTVSADFADLASVSADVRRVDDEFQSLGGRRSGSINTALSLGGNVNVHKFVERSGLALPLSWGWLQSKSLPELQTGSDVVLLDRENERTENKALRASLSVTRARKSSKPLMYHTLDAMSFRISGAVNENFSPTKLDTVKSYSFGLQYNFRPRTPKEVRLVRSLRLGWFPTNIGISAAKDQANATSVDRRDLATFGPERATRETLTRSSRSQVVVDAIPLTSKAIATRYGFTSSRDHSREENGEIIRGVNWGLEVGRTQNANVTFTPGLPKLLSWVAPNLAYDTQYTEGQPFEQEFTDTLTGNLERPRNVRNQNTSKLTVNFNLTKVFTPPPRRAPDDTTSGRSLNPLAGFGALGRRLTDIRANVSVTRGSSFDRVSERPDLMYQFGLTDLVDDEIRDRGAPGRQERYDQTRNLSGNASGGVQLWRGVTITADYTLSEERRQYSRNQQERRSITWPDINLNWGNVERIKGLEKLVESASLNSGFQIAKEVSGIDLHNPDRESIRREWAPLLGAAATFNSGLHAKLSADRSTAIGQSRLGGGSRDESFQSSYTLGFEYRIKTARKVSMPLLGRGEPTAFTSELGLFLDLNLRTNLSVQKAQPGNPDIVNSSIREWNIAPHANYSFSRNVTGTLEARFGQMNNLKDANQSRRTIGLSVSATLQF